MTTNLDYQTLNQALHSHQIGMNAAELHGFLSGLLCGGVQDNSWKTLTYQFTNDGHAYPVALMQQVEQLHQTINHELGDDEDFSFELWLDENSLFSRADSLSEWVSHFLLGLGLAQPHLDQASEEIREAVGDLNDIANLGYDEDDDQEELDVALTEISEYVRAIAMFFYSDFNRKQQPQQTTLH
ncbi:YecA/YgfB family protein [Testudinibacter sp. P27/CKL/0425]